MLSSIQIGLLSLPESTRTCLIALGDNPQIEVEVVQNLLDCFIGPEVAPLILIPSYQMRRGHPWIIHKNLWSEIFSIRPPETMRDLFRKSADKIQYLITNSPSILKIWTLRKIMTMKNLFWDDTRIYDRYSELGIF